ncbi:hypothetical protein [Variovorax rhizosphaerae]|uniref:Uncharacterized protein n=1 Tax=Variovorax rhizosphaerae TaxID=1836200 RepID=A0ABU8WJU5_9BURK
MNFRPITLVLYSFFASIAHAQDATKVEQAIAFLRSACVTSGSTLEINGSGNGALQLRGTLPSGIQGSVQLSKREVEGLADAASQVSAAQATEMRNCMKPYIDKILTVMLTGGAVVGPDQMTIGTNGYYFLLDEFDRFMAAVAEKTGHTKYIELSKATQLHVAKIRHYAGIARSNDLGYDGGDSFSLNTKGVAYVLGKGLVK